MTPKRWFAAGLALTLFAGSAHAMGGRKKRKKPDTDPMAEGLKRVEMAEKANEAGQGELARRAYEQAVKHFEQAAEKTPNDPEAWNQLGFTRRKVGDYRAALKAYTRALELRPGYAEAIEYQAEAYLALGMYDRVMESYLTLTRAGDREAAQVLLKASRVHVVAKRDDPSNGSNFESFSNWVFRREALADKLRGPHVRRGPKRW